MDLMSRLLLISFIYTCLFGVIVAQVIALNRIFRSWAWKLIGAGFVLLGTIQVWGLIRLPHAILKAKAQGILPESLSTEQWLRIACGFVLAGVWIAAFDRLRRDLRAIGL